MRVQEYTIDGTREAHAEAFRYAKAVPQDKVEWKPLDAGRTVLDCARELAQCPDWAHDLVVKGTMDYSDEAQTTQKTEMESWTTVEACEAAGKQKLERLFEAYRVVPDARLDETMDLPFGPGGSMRTFTILEMMDYPRWNANYHLGQIAYIQTLYGDKALY